MKSQYVYFGKKGYHAEVPGADETTTATTVALQANEGGGMLPGDQAANQANGTNAVHVFVRKSSDGSDASRGSGYGTTDENGLTIVSVNPKDTEVVRVPDLGFIWSSQTLQVQNVAADAVYGFDMESDDVIWMIDRVRGATSPPHLAIGADICVPMKNYLGADSVAFSGTHWDASALDVASLKFKAAKGSATDDVVHLICTAGKFTEVCQVMEEVANGNNYDEAITMFDLNENGEETVYKGFADRGVTIYGCIIEMAAI